MPRTTSLLLAAIVAATPLAATAGPLTWGEVIDFTPPPPRPDNFCVGSCPDGGNYYSGLSPRKVDNAALYNKMQQVRVANRKAVKAGMSGIGVHATMLRSVIVGYTFGANPAFYPLYVWLNGNLGSGDDGYYDGDGDWRDNNGGNEGYYDGDGDWKPNP